MILAVPVVPVAGAGTGFSGAAAAAEADFFFSFFFQTFSRRLATPLPSSKTEASFTTRKPMSDTACSETHTNT